MSVAKVLPIRPVKTPDGGPVQLMSAREVSELWPEEIRPSPRWIIRNVPGKRKLGRKRPFWYRHEVMDWFRNLEAAS